MMKVAKVRIYSSATDFRRYSKIKILQLCLSKECVFIHVLTEVIRKEYIANWSTLFGVNGVQKEDQKSSRQRMLLQSHREGRVRRGGCMILNCQ